MRTVALSLLFTFAFGCSFGQEWKPVSADDVKTALNRCAMLYRSENYTLRFEQTLVKNTSNPNDVIQTSGSISRGKGKQYRSETGDKIIIQNNDLKVLIDTTQHVIGIIQPDTLFDVIQTDQLSGHPGWKDLKCRSRVSGSETVYELTGPALMIYQSIELTIDRKTGYMTEMTLHFHPDNYFSETTGDETMEHPKVTIRYFKPTSIKSSQSTLFDVSKWVVNEQQTYRPTAFAAGYTLQDYRYTHRP